MKTDHPFIDDIPAYAIGALDQGETIALELHLKTCELCQAELASYQVIRDNLLLAVPSQQPSAALRQRLLARLPAAKKPVPARPRTFWSFNQIAFGFAMLALLGFSIYSMLQIQALQRQQADLQRQLQTGQMALAALAYPETRSIVIENAGVAGTLLLESEQNVAVLIVWNMPALQLGQTYQVWLIDPQGNRVSGGTFNSRSDQPFTSFSVVPPGSLANYKGIGVTVEPSGGSSQPTGTRLFKVDF